jgi:hypothetical protein
MFATPGTTPVTNPVDETLAIAELELVHKNVRCNGCPEASFAVADNCRVATGTSVAALFEISTLAVLGGAGGGGPVMLSELPPHDPISHERATSPAERKYRCNVGGDREIGAGRGATILICFWRIPNFSGLSRAKLQPILLITLVLLTRSVGSLPPVTGSYVVRTMNGQTLPAELRIPAADGDFRLVRLEQGVLTLKPDGRFTLYFRYYHQLVRRGSRPTETPVLSESEVGTYRVEANKLLLRPTRKDRTVSRSAFGAMVGGDEIRAAYTFLSGGAHQKLRLVLRRDAHFW